MNLMQIWQRRYLDLKNQVEKTEKLLENLIIENNKLKSEVTIVSLEITTLKTENEQLTAENIKLKERLGINSKNSSIPTSKEIYKIKKENPKKSLRKQGGQVGHKGYMRDAMIANEVTEVNLNSSQCDCGGILSIVNQVHIHQKIDIPEIKPYVTEYHMQKGRCKRCGKRKKASLPLGVTTDLFGPRIKTVIGALTGFYKNSKREVANILRDMFNVDISLGSISNSEYRIANKCAESYEDIELALSYSKMLHIDETSHYNKDKLGWCWMFSNALMSLVKLTDSRGKKVLQNSVFGQDGHIVISDRYCVYNYFDAENRQVCWSHLAREFERFAHSSYVEVKYLGKSLRDIANELFVLKKALHQEQINMLRFLRRTKKLRRRMWYYLKTMSNKPELLQAARMAKNIMKSENMMWKFLDDPNNIPLTNNHAEQQIRHYVTYRKNSYFTQSVRGNEFLERIISLYLTWKKQGQNPVHNLQNLLIA